MGSSIANVQSSIADVISSIRDVQPDAEFGAAQYKDVTDTFAYQLDQAITSNDTDVSNAINTWSASGGGDTPEAQINCAVSPGDRLRCRLADRVEPDHRLVRRCARP